MTATPAPDAAPLQQQLQCDVAVVGGGISGASAALAVAEAGRSVCLLEAGELASEASGRSNGQVIPTLKKEDPQALRQRYGDVHGERIIAAIGKAAADVFELIDHYRIACEANRAGWLQPALGSAQSRIVEQRCEAWAQAGARVRWLDRSQTAERLGSPFYDCGWLAEDGGCLQPVSYVHGLATAARALGATLCTHSAVQDIRRTGDGWRLTTARGEVRAHRVVLAAALKTGRLAPSLSRQVVPATFYQLASAPLGEAGTTILPGCAATSDLQGDIHFFRKDGQGRLVTGGTFIWTRDWQGRLPGQVQERLRRVFPQLGSLAIETSWSGEVAMTRDGFPRLARLGPDCFGWIGCNSRGIALSTLMGRELARLATGTDPRKLSFPLESGAAIPFRGLAPLGVATVLTWLRIGDVIRRWRHWRPA